MAKKSRRITLNGPHLKRPVVTEITPSDRIGSGSFALVFEARVNSVKKAVKIWKKMETSMANKIDYLVANQFLWNLPDNVYRATESVKDEGGQIIGMTMDMMDPTALDMGKTFNRRQWASLGMDHKKIAKLYWNGFFDLEQIGKHFVILDISPRNVPFVPTTLKPEWIDFDSWRVIGKSFNEPFMVTPQFIDPLLMDPRYRVVSNMPEPLPEHMMAMFGRMFCSSFFGVDVYGGSHPKIPASADRVSGRIWFLDPQVILPRSSSHPYLATDELLHALQLTYVQDKRGLLKYQLFEDMYSKMKQCNSCGNYHARSTCPVCSQVVPHVKPVLLESVTLKELLKSSGSIITADVFDRVMVAVAVEGSQVVAYRRNAEGDPAKVDLFEFVPGLRYKLISSEFVAINRPASKEIEVWNLSSGKLDHITTSELYNSKRVPFSGSQGSMIRLVRQSMMKHEKSMGDFFVDRKLPVMISENQTWFWSDHKADVHLLFMNILLDPEVMTEKHEYILLVNGKRVDLSEAIPSLSRGEDLMGTAVRFGQHTVLIRRLTEKNGVNYIRTSIVGLDGVPLQLSSDVSLKAESDHKNPQMRAFAYTDVDEFGSKADPYVWVATDEGVGKENIQTGTFTVLGPTKDAVTSADGLISVMSRGGRRHWLVTRPSSVDYLVFNSV